MTKIKPCACIKAIPSSKLKDDKPTTYRAIN